MADLEVNFSLEEQPTIEADFSIDVQGITEHNLLVNRDLPNQHPMTAITGLVDSLSGKQDSLVAGENIQITGNIISATDTTYTAGQGISIDNGVISNTQVSAVWGNITGTLSSQTDLQNALNAKQDTISDLSTIRIGAELGATALQPNSNISELYNDVGYITSSALAPYVLASSLATVATTGAYSDLSGTPTIPTDTSDLTNGAGFITSSALNGYATQAWVGQQGFITGITSTDVITALGYTPYSNSNPSGYITSAALTGYATESYVNTADNNLQTQIDAITAASDVTDIVGTYAELQAYDTTSLPNNSIIKVLQDESRDDETTYYRWVITGGVGAWVLIGEEGPYYTKSQADSMFVAQTTKVNNKALSTDITLTASDVGALPDSTIIPTVNNATLTIQKNSTNVATFTANASSNVTANISVPTDTSDLTNNAGFITSSALSGYATETWVGQQGYITGISSSDVTTALGYTPYNSSNPSGYITGITSGDVTTALGYTPYNSTNPDGFITSSALTPYVLSSSLATVATSGSYNDLNDKPTIPAAQVNSDWNAVSGVAQILNKPTLATVATSGAYSDLSGTPTIPTVNNATLTITQGGTTKGTFTANASSDVTIALDAGGGGGGGSYTAGDGIIIQNDVISVNAESTAEVDVEATSEVTIQDLLATITGYDDTATQVLKNINGTLTWVTEV